MKNKNAIKAVSAVLFLLLNIYAFSQQKENPSEMTAQNSDSRMKAEEAEADRLSISSEAEKELKKYKSQSPDIISPDELLGLTPEKAYEILGAPEEVFSMRGEREWQDDVVFYYKNHIYLFWFKNRVWQFRADLRFKGKVMDLRPGMSREDTVKLLGQPYKSGDNSDIYMNPKNITRYETGFPVRMKIFYGADKRISDIYVYRGDF